MTLSRIAAARQTPPSPARPRKRQKNAAITNHDIRMDAWPRAAPDMNHPNTNKMGMPYRNNRSVSVAAIRLASVAHMITAQAVNATEITYQMSAPQNTDSFANGTIRIANGGGYT